MRVPFNVCINTKRHRSGSKQIKCINNIPIRTSQWCCIFVFLETISLSLVRRVGSNQTTVPTQRDVKLDWPCSSSDQLFENLLLSNSNGIQICARTRDMNHACYKTQGREKQPPNRWTTSSTLVTHTCNYCEIDSHAAMPAVGGGTLICRKMTDRQLARNWHRIKGFRHTHTHTHTRFIKTWL